jgi:hypothetical protein
MIESFLSAGDCRLVDRKQDIVARSLSRLEQFAILLAF